ncbi:MAG: galactokinase [Oscillospiraceae bacterium]|nr:galactokinase [Oscillospiraceae bacterium]
MNEYGEALAYLYADAEAAKIRYSNAVKEFERRFGTGREIIFVSAPGRTEIGGNHTDHQRGSVLAAAVDLDMICVVSPKDEPEIRIESEGYRPEIIDLKDLSPRPDEYGRASALIRGVAAGFRRGGYEIGGLDAYTVSLVKGGSGLSSSAAFEVATGNMLSHLYNGGAVTPERIAMIGQYAENEYVGKPSGLMDQMASSVGGFVRMDFADPDNPVIEPVKFDLEASGYALCVTDTKSSHSDLNAEYAAITVEMGAVAEYFGKRFLSEVCERDFYGAIPHLRAKAGDRAVLRAIHFFDEDARVKKQAAALESGDIKEFLRLVNRSGDSSFKCLQNIYAEPREQSLSLALALSGRVLADAGGAWRVHGGGFAGTVQAYVPHGVLSEYRAVMDGVFGEGACRALRVRPAGGVKLWRS